MSDLLPPDKAAKELVTVFARQPALKKGFCHLPACQEVYQPGDPIVQVRWGPGPKPWGTFHAACYDGLPEMLDVVSGLLEMPANEELVNGRATVTFAKLPDGERHRGRRYVVRINGHDAFYSGEVSDVHAVTRFCRDYLEMNVA